MRKRKENFCHDIAINLAQFPVQNKSTIIPTQAHKLLPQ